MARLGPWLLCAALLLLVERARAADPYFAEVTQELTVLTDAGARTERPSRGRFALSRGEILLVPEADGQTFRVRGERVRVGFAFGTPENAVVWQDAPASQHVLYVPPALSVRSLAVSVESDQSVEVLRLTTRTEPMRALRFREEAERWLMGRGTRPAAVDAPSERLLALLADAGLGAGPPAPSLRALGLFALEQTYLAQHALASPWLPRVFERTETVTPARPLRVFAREGDVVSVLVRPKLNGPAEVRLERGETLHARLLWTGWERIDAEGYVAAARLRRFTVSGPLRIRSLRGEVEVVVRRHVRTRTLRDVLATLRRRPEVAAGDPLARLADGTFDRAEPFRGLPEALRPPASLLALEHATSVAEVERFSSPALGARNHGSGQLRVSALLHLLRVGGTPEASVCVEQDIAPKGDVHLAVDLAISDLCEHSDGGAALGVRAFHALASRSAEDGVYLRLARELSRRVERAVDRPLADDIVARLALRVPDDGRADGTCRTMGRARLFEPGAHVLEVVGPRPRLLSLRATSPVSSRVDVGPFTLSVQGGGAMPSRVRVPAGALALVVHGEPVLVELAQEGVAPCAGLREARLTFPSEQLSPVSVARSRGAATGFELETADGQTKLRGEIDVRMGARVAHVSLLGREPRARFRVLPPGEASEVALEHVPRGLFVRGFVEQARRRSFEPGARDLPVLRSPEQWIVRLREASRAIHAAPADQPNLMALEQRAEAMVALGYTRLAEYDYVRLAAMGVYPRERSGERLGPLNLAAKLPPLSQDDLRTLQEALRTDERGDVEQAARMFEGLRMPLATARAASLRAEQSWAQNDAELALTALAWAVRARTDSPDQELEQGLNRLESAVRFVQPATLDTSAGSFVERIDVTSAEESRRHAVGRAWLDAPDDAHVLREDEVLGAHFSLKEPLALRIETGCRGLSGEPCTMEAKLDGQRVKGERLRLPVGHHELELSTQVRGLGWVRFCAPEGPCDAAPIALVPEMSRRWFAATPTDPARLSVAGPTVVRLVLRAIAGPASVRVRAGNETHELQLSPTAQAEDVLSLDVAILEPQGTLEVEVLSGTAYLRPAVAEPLVAARRVVTAPERKNDEITRQAAPVLRLETPGGRPPRKAGYVTLWAHQRWVPNQVADLDSIAQGSPFLETAVRVLTTLPYKLKLQLGVLTRLRSAADSVGFFGRIDIGAYNHFFPRVILSARATGQYLPPWSWGTRNRLSAYWSIDLPHAPLIMPWGALHYRTSPRYAARRNEVDPDVYSNFAVQHDRGSWLGLAAYYRPLLDLSITHNTFLMTNADLHTLDRVGTEARLNVLAGRGLAPWVNVGYGASYRFPDRHRPVAFWRHVFEVDAQSWLWVSGRQRLALQGTLARILDVERWVGMMQLSWMFSPGRGVLDLTADEVEFRERMQEGAMLGDGLLGGALPLGVRGGD